MMICEVIPYDMWDKILLQDSNGETGGISFVGETLKDFIDECNYSPYDSYETLRSEMENCSVAIEFPYISKHGMNNDLFPRDVNIIRRERISRLRTLVVLDRPLREEEMLFYDISEVA